MIEIIPAIDLYQGKCVRLTKGDYRQMTIYPEAPIDIAIRFEAHGIKKLHLVDLEGAKSGNLSSIEILKNITKSTGLQVDFGGGISSEYDLEAVFDAGAKQAVIGSLAVRQSGIFSQWIKKFGSSSFILGADALNGKVAINGWFELSEIKLEDFLQEYFELGIRYVLSTDISKDGMMQGASIELYRSLQQRFNELNIIASGGITNISEIEELDRIGIYGVIIGKALYEKKILIEELARFIA